MWRRTSRSRADPLGTAPAPPHRRAPIAPMLVPSTVRRRIRQHIFGRPPPDFGGVFPPTLVDLNKAPYGAEPPPYCRTRPRLGRFRAKLGAHIGPTSDSICVELGPRLAEIAPGRIFGPTSARGVGPSLDRPRPNLGPSFGWVGPKLGQFRQTCARFWRDFGHPQTLRGPPSGTRSDQGGVRTGGRKMAG